MGNFSEVLTNNQAKNINKIRHERNQKIGNWKEIRNIQ